jgi:hypothetical protein
MLATLSYVLLIKFLIATPLMLIARTANFVDHFHRAAQRYNRDNSKPLSLSVSSP